VEKTELRHALRSKNGSFLHFCLCPLRTWFKQGHVATYGSDFQRKITVREALSQAAMHYWPKQARFYPHGFGQPFANSSASKNRYKLE